MRTIFLRLRRRKSLAGIALLGFFTVLLVKLRTDQTIPRHFADALAVEEKRRKDDENLEESFSKILQDLNPRKEPQSRETVQTAKDPTGYFVGLHHSSNEKIVNPPGHKPTILIWSAQFGSRVTYLANPEVCGTDVDCDITYDRNKLDESGAVVFHYTGAHLDAMPARRHPDQLYLWWTLEKNHGAKMEEFNNFFNLTFTYRSDSGIYAPYGSTNLILQELRKANELELEPLLAKKRGSGKIAAWAVSNCGVKRRNDLAKSLIDAGLNVELFGRCHGGKQIGKGQYSEAFYEALSQYKFYFSFENGYHCKDYMTEKFWFNGLRSGAVPIVFGPKKEDVEAAAPKHSFIHAEDYPDAASLVKYLDYLSQNETAYREYLEWRTWAKNPELMEERLRPENRDNDLRSFCKLCRLLQEEEEARRQGKPRRQMIVPSMREFWWDMENQECVH